MVKKPNPLEKILTEGRRQVEVEPEELDEARRRRSLIAQALSMVFPGARTYNAGSLAHGDALTPLRDVDRGCVVPDPDGRYGPGRGSPRPLMELARAGIRDHLGPEYPCAAAHAAMPAGAIDPIAPMEAQSVSIEATVSSACDTEGTALGGQLGGQSRARPLRALDA